MRRADSRQGHKIAPRCGYYLVTQACISGQVSHMALSENRLPQNPMIYHPFPIRIVLGYAPYLGNFLKSSFCILLQHPSMLQDVRGTRSQWKTCQMTCHGLNPRASVFPDLGKAICMQIMQMLHPILFFNFRSCTVVSFVIF
jgi:hypothetical protein